MTTKFFVQVEPAWRAPELEVTVNLQRQDSFLFQRKVNVGDQKGAHARLLANLQTCDPDPLIEVEEGHFTFTFLWTREKGQRLIRRCSQCQALVAPWLSFCPHCDEPLPQAGA